MARVFSISKGQNGYECSVSTLEFGQNRDMICSPAAQTVAPAVDAKLSVSAPSPNMP